MPEIIIMNLDPSVISVNLHRPTVSTVVHNNNKHMKHRLFLRAANMGFEVSTSILMRLYSPVESTRNVSNEQIEHAQKVNLG